MRPIEFRLVLHNKIVGYEKWYPGCIEDGEYKAKPCWLYSKDGKYWNPTSIFHRTKDQFIDKCDRNGAKVFEGDELITKWQEGFDDEISEEIKTVKYNQKRAGFQPFIWHHVNDEDEYYSCRLLSYEVIGNIYENPELLEAKNG